MAGSVASARRINRQHCLAARFWGNALCPRPCVRWLWNSAACQRLSCLVLRLLMTYIQGLVMLPAMQDWRQLESLYNASSGTGAGPDVAAPATIGAPAAAPALPAAPTVNQRQLSPEIDATHRRKRPRHQQVEQTSPSAVRSEQAQEQAPPQDSKQRPQPLQMRHHLQASAALHNSLARPSQRAAVVEAACHEAEAAIAAAMFSQQDEQPHERQQWQQSLLPLHRIPDMPSPQPPTAAGPDAGHLAGGNLLQPATASRPARSTRVEPGANLFGSVAAFNHLQTYMGTMRAAGRLDPDLVAAAQELGLLPRHGGAP